MTYAFSAQRDVASDLDWYIKWSNWLNPGEHIVTSTWSAPQALTLHDGLIDQLGVTTGIWVKGGVVGQSYLVTNKITTDASPARNDERSILFTTVQK